MLNKLTKYAVIVISLVRLLLLWMIPLLDKTEARYSEIARIMSDTGNLVTPQYDYGIPFWAKPPLSTWLSSFSIDIFGVNEFAARFPAYIVSLLIIYIVAKFVIRRGGDGWLAALILITLPEFLIHMGVVSTDTVLSLAVLLTMFGFWEGITRKSKLWGYLFFIGIGIGLLAKGPIIIVLAGGPIFLWCCVKPKRFIDLFTKLPWISGLIVTAAVALPWYLAAEDATPGFIDYFIVGEHFKRFVEPGWSGDMYGFAKRQPLGIIWAFLYAFALPWIFTLTGKLIKNRSNIFNSDYRSMLVLWLLWTPLFFSISRNLIHTYTLPVMVPIALLVIDLWDQVRGKKRIIYISLIAPALIVLATVALPFVNKKEIMNTDKYLIEDNIKTDSYKLYSLNDKTYSSMFYSKGKSTVVFSNEKLQQESKREGALLERVIRDGDDFYILVYKTDKEQFEKEFGSIFKAIDQNMNNTLYIRIDDR